MRIEPNRMDTNITAANPYLNKNNASSKPSYVANDRVEISKEARDMMNNSEVRLDKVDHVRNLVQNGTYKVSGSEIAGKILKDLQTYNDINSQRK